MAENESLRKTLEHYIEQKQGKLEEVRQLDLIIARLSHDLGQASEVTQIVESPRDSMNNGWQEKTEIVSQSVAGRTNVRPDEFFGMTYTTAAKAYLEKVRHAVSMDDLLEALNRGGCPVGGKEPKKTLYISLIRDVRNFVPIPGQSGMLGLRKFYPNLKAINEKKNGTTPRTKPKKRGRPKKHDSAIVPETSSPKQKSRLAGDQTARKGDSM
jgi:hypothetical protein